MKRAEQLIKSNAFIIMMVMILSASFVTQQVYAFDGNKESVELADESGDETETLPQVGATKAAINSLVHVELAQGYHQIMEIRFESKNDPTPSNKVTLFDSGHYRTLFRQVISPNAP